MSTYQISKTEEDGFVRICVFRYIDGNMFDCYLHIVVCIRAWKLFCLGQCRICRSDFCGAAL